jgi:hypothetical protein
VLYLLTRSTPVVGRLASVEVDKMDVVQPAVGREAKFLVFFFPAGVFVAFPAAADNGLLAVGKTRRTESTPRFACEFFRQDALLVPSELAITARIVI